MPYAQGKSGWDVETSDEAKFFSFGLNVAGAESFKLSELSFEERATGAGPSAMIVTINGITVYEDDVPESEIRLHKIDLTNIEGFDNEDLLSATVRIKGWGNNWRETTGNGDWRINGIIVEGDVNIGSPATIPYAQNFSNFVFQEGSVVEFYGIKNEWQLISEGDELDYKGDWRSGSAA